MELFGLSLAQLAAVFGGAATLAVLLHLLRAHRRRQQVPFLPLWEGVLAQRDASQLLSRMPRWLALLLTLAILALLALALGDPRLAERSAVVTHRVVLIDAGLASQARLSGEQTRLDAVKRWAERVAGQAGPLLPTMLVSVDAAPAPLGPFSSDASALARLVTDIAATDLATDVERAHRFAIDALAGRKPAEVVFIGSGKTKLSSELAADLKRAGIATKQISVGSKADNVAITTFAARRYPLDRNRSELLLGLHNQGQRAARVELTLLGDGQPIDVRSFELAPGAREQRVYDDLAFAGARLEAHLKALDPDQDVLSTDSRAYAVLPPRKKLRVLCVTSGNRYLEAALLLDEYFKVDVAKPSARLLTQEAFADYDAVVFDRFAPSAAPGIPALYLAPPASSSFEIDGELARPRFEHVQREHPILRHVALADVNIAIAQHVRPRRGDTVIGGSADGPLLLSGEREGQPFVALTFDVARSDLPLRIAWPLLLINTLDWFANERKELAPAHVVGEVAHVAVDAAARTATIETPGGTKLAAPIVTGSVAFSPERAGFFQLQAEGGAAADRKLIAVGLDAALPPELRGGATTFDVTSLDRPRVPDIWSMLLGVAALLIAFEWLAFHRRWAP